MKQFLSVLILTTAVFCCGISVSASPFEARAAFVLDSGGTLSEEVLKSDLMGRDMPFRVLLPEEYGEAKNKDRIYPVLYLLHGLTGSYKNWTDFTALKKSTFASEFVIVMPEGANGWYTDSISDPADKYESYIIKELIPLVESRYRTGKEKDKRAVAGLSMGGYGAMKFGIKYPGMFALAGSFSGALGAAEIDPSTVTGFKAVASSITAVYGPMDSKVRKENDIFALIRDADDAALKKIPFLYVDCGTEDFLISQNQAFVKLLSEKKIRHEFRQLPGGHDWKFWNTQIEQFLFAAIQQKRVRL